MRKKRRKIVRVFIVDDSAIIRERLEMILSELKGISNISVLIRWALSS
jgi:hypothetical protein